MDVRVRFFASLVDRVGGSEETVCLGAEADVRDLWVELERRHPALVALPYTPLVACDLEYADWDRPLTGVREVAFLPPVSGG